MRVIVVDSHDLFRTGVAAHLRTQADIEVVGQASTGARGVRLCSELRPDVLFIDADSADGLNATRIITEALPETRVVALTSSAVPGGSEAVRAGACCVVSRADPVEHVGAAARAAAAGATWISPPVAEELLKIICDGHGGQREALGAPLSEREAEVLKLVAAGLDNVEIADTLTISPSTAKSHVSSVLRKLKLPNRIQAATYAVRNKLD